MDCNLEYLFQTLDSVLHDKPVPQPPADIDWERYFTAASAGEVIFLLYNKLDELQGQERPPQDRMQWLKYYSMQSGMKRLQCYDLLAKLLNAAEKRGIRVLVFKGPVLANLYPQPMMRNSCDMDIYVDPKDLPELERLMVELGYVKNQEHSKDCVPVYMYEKILLVEAHCRLYEDYEGKRIDMLESMDLTRQDHQVSMEVCGLPVTTLGYEEHLIFLMFHLIKHISYNGCSLKTIIDIVLYVNAYLEQIDLKSFWSRMKQLGYDTFCRTLFSIGCYYFGMRQDIFIDDSYSENIAVGTMEHLYATGILKYTLVKQEEDRRAASIAFQSLQGKEDKKVGTFRMWVKTFFPSSKDLSFRYMYARKHPSLVWVAWIHRAFNNLTIRFLSKEHTQDMVGDMRLAKQKLALLKELDLMHKD